MSYFCFLSFCLLALLPNGYCQLTSNTIPEQISGGSPVVFASENATDVTVVCEIFNGDNPRATVWILTSGGVTNILRFFANGTAEDDTSQNFFVSGEPFLQQTTEANLTILTFTNSLNGSLLECLSGNTMVGNFTLRLAEPPKLVEGSQQITTEGNVFSFSMQQTEGVPVDIISFQWYFNGILIITESSTSPNVTEYPFITFTNVSRTDSGNYTITLSHKGGVVNGSFHLDVQYGPEGVAQSGGPFYFLIGENMTLIAFTNIGGNPTTSSLWSIESSLITDGNRYTTSIPGQLTIVLLKLNDSGIYRNNITNTVNGNVLNLVNDLELHVVEYPTAPRDLTVVYTGSQFINISFLNPDIVGTPVFTHFIIEGISSVSIINMTVVSMSVDSGFLNDYTVDGLIPNTEYSLTVRALSTVEQLGLLLSEPSEAVVFNTSVGAPIIGAASVENVNGNLTVSWEILHNGGIELEQISVLCGLECIDGTRVNVLSTTKKCLTNLECDNVTVGPVTAGANYSCLVTAENNIGGGELRTKYIFTKTGLPSPPVIISVSGELGYANITLRVDSFGVLVASDFTFFVLVFNPLDTINPVAVRNIPLDSIGSSILEIVVEGFSEGTYFFSMISHNIYSSLSSKIMIEKRPNGNESRTMVITTSSITSPSVMQTIITTNCSMGLSGGVIGVITIAIVLLLVVAGQFFVVLVFIGYKTRVAKDAGKKLSNRNLTTVQPAGTDYNFTDRVYDKPEHPKTIDVKQNIAYGEMILNS